MANYCYRKCLCETKVILTQTLKKPKICRLKTKAGLLKEHILLRRKFGYDITRNYILELDAQCTDSDDLPYIQ